MGRQGTRAVFLAVVVLAGMTTGVGGAVTTDGDTPHTAAGTAPGLVSDDSGGGQAAVVAGPQAQTDNSIDITHEFRLTPDEPGAIEVQWRFAVPDSVAELNTTLPAGAMESSVDGFERRDGTLVWSESEQATRTPTATFTLAVNETTDDGSPKYVDTGDWALVKRPPMAEVGYSYYESAGEPSVTRTNITAGSGVSANAMVYLGEYGMTTRSAHGQEFRLVVPAAATLTEERSDIFDSVTAASDALRVGDRDGTVTMFAAPTSVPWGVSGLQRGDNAFYTVANRSVDDPNNTWVHEYVHTRQRFNTTAGTEWFIEASAEYYAAQLSLQQGRIDFASFSDSLDNGAERRFDDVVLANPDSWHDLANYNKGGLVAGDIDRRLRLASGGSASLQAVVQRLNSYDSSIPVGQQRFLGAVETAGGSSVADTARRFTETTDGPEMWSQRQHGEAFSDLPARFAYTFPTVGSDGLRVRGPYRNGTAPDGGLVTGETLVADIAVENVGGSTGTYDLTVTRGGGVVADRTGTAAAGEVVTEPVSVGFPTAGEYRLSTGSDSLRVGVAEPATPEVADVFANRTAVDSGGRVRVTAVVANGNDRPASGVVKLRQGDNTLVERGVSLDVGESTDIVATASLTERGTTVFSAGGGSVEVTVGGASTADQPTAGDDGETAGSSGPGFGPVAVLVALGVSLLVARRVE